MYLESGNEFNFFLPPYIVFGSGKRSAIPEYAQKLGITRVLLVVDPFFVGAPKYRGAPKHFAEIQAGLESAGIQAICWSGVVPDPTDVSVDEAAGIYREQGCDGVICIGGGSAIDTGKSVAVVVGSGSPSIRLHMPPRYGAIEGMAPTICVPTTSGTGAEVNPYSMVTNTETGEKVLGYAGWEMLAAQRVAIVDPQLAASMPPRLTAVTGLDALCQAIECYLTQSPNPISDSLALHAIHLVGRSLRCAVDDGGDMAARADMSLAATLATMAFPNAGLSYPHFMSEPMADLYHLEHGVAVGSVLVASLEALLPTKTERLAEVARALGVPDQGQSPKQIAQAGIERVRQLLADVRFPTLAQAVAAAGGNDAIDVEVLVADVAQKKPQMIRTSEDREQLRIILRRSLEF